MICPTCGQNPVRVSAATDCEGNSYQVSGHACHCIRDKGTRIAVGICCGRELGPELLAAEDASDRKRRKRA